MTNIVRNQAQSSATPQTYTGSFADSSAAAVTAQVVFTPAANVNGAIVEYIGFSGTPSSAGGSNLAIIAKSTAPASANDGDVIFRASTGSGSASSAIPLVPQNVQQAVRLKIPAGKGLYINQVTLGGSPAQDMQKTVLYTLL